MTEPNTPIGSSPDDDLFDVPRTTSTGPVASPAAVTHRTLQSATSPLSRPGRKSQQAVNPMVGAARSRYAVGVPGCESPPSAGGGPPEGGEGGNNVRFVVGVLKRIMTTHRIYVTQAIQAALPSFPPALQAAVRQQLLSVGDGPQGAATPAQSQSRVGPLDSPIGGAGAQGGAGVPDPLLRENTVSLIERAQTVSPRNPHGPGVVGARVEVRPHVPATPRGPSAEVRPHVPQEPRGPEAEVKPHDPVVRSPAPADGELPPVPSASLFGAAEPDSHPMATMGDEGDEPAPVTETDPGSAPTRPTERPPEV